MDDHKSNVEENDDFDATVARFNDTCKHIDAMLDDLNTVEARKKHGIFWRERVERKRQQDVKTDQFDSDSNSD